MAYGATALDDQQAQSLLLDAGSDNAMALPTPPGAPTVTVGRKPTA